MLKWSGLYVVNLNIFFFALPVDNFSSFSLWPDGTGFLSSRVHTNNSVQLNNRFVG